MKLCFILKKQEWDHFLRRRKWSSYGFTVSLITQWCLQDIMWRAGVGDGSVSNTYPVQGVPGLGFPEPTQTPGGHGNLPAIPAMEDEEENSCYILAQFQGLDLTWPSWGSKGMTERQTNTPRKAKYRWDLHSDREDRAPQKLSMCI